MKEYEQVEMDFEHDINEELLDVTEYLEENNYTRREAKKIKSLIEILDKHIQAEFLKEGRPGLEVNYTYQSSYFNVIENLFYDDVASVDIFIEGIPLPFTLAVGDSKEIHDDNVEIDCIIPFSKKLARNYDNIVEELQKVYKEIKEEQNEFEQYHE